jgi:carbamate kinase
VDKDLTSALLAVELDARALVILTDVDGVHRSWPPTGDGAGAVPSGGPPGGPTGGPPSAPPAAIGRITAAELRGLRLDAGTMCPKALAACRFAEATGRPAHIGPLERAAEVAEGLAGTTVVP